MLRAIWIALFSALLLTACHESEQLPKGHIKLLDGNLIRCDGGIKGDKSSQYICYPSLKSENQIIISPGLVQEVFYRVNELR